MKNNWQESKRRQTTLSRDVVNSKTIDDFNKYFNCLAQWLNHKLSDSSALYTTLLDRFKRSENHTGTAMFRDPVPLSTDNLEDAK